MRAFQVFTVFSVFLGIMGTANAQWGQAALDRALSDLQGRANQAKDLVESANQRLDQNSNDTGALRDKANGIEAERNAEERLTSLGLDRGDGALSDSSIEGVQ